MNSLNDFLSKVGGEHAASARVWVGLSPIAVLGVVFGFGIENVREHALELLVISVLSYLASGPVLLIAGLTFLSAKRPRAPRPSATVVVFAMAGLVAGLVLATMITQSGIVEDFDFARQVVSRTWLGIYWAVLGTVVLSSSDSYRDEAQELGKQIERASKLVQDRDQVIQRVRKDMVASVSRTLSEAMDKQDPKNLNRLADAVIEPLTMKLQHDPVRLEIASSQSRSKIGLGPILRKALTFPRSIWLLALAGVLYPSVIVFNRFGPIAILDLVGLGLIIAISFLLIKTIPSKSVFLSGGILALSVVAVYLLGSSLEQQLDPSSTFLGVLNIGGWLVSLFVLFLNETNAQRERQVLDLEAKLKEASWLEQRLQQEVWVESRKLARIVHGTVQAKIRAAAVSSATLTKQELDDLRNECLVLVESGLEAVSLDEFISQSRRLWGELLNIKLSVSPVLEPNLSDDRIALTAVIEVIREALTNAVRHGQAKNVDILIQEQDLEQDQMTITVKNDGVAVSTKTTAGFGSSVLDEVTSKWSLSNESGLVVLEARIPIQQAAPRHSESTWQNQEHESAIDGPSR